jgi:hypothetical protein
MPEYGVSQALGGRKVEGSGEILVANPACVCPSPVQVMVCPYGHLLECHYQMTCEQAECGHYKAATEEDDFDDLFEP